MAPKNTVTDASTKKVMSKGAWTAEEDNKLAHCVEVHGAKRWKTVALKSGRTDNEIKNYWNSHLSKKIIDQTQKEKMPDQPSTPLATMHQKTSDAIQVEEEGSAREAWNLETGNFDVDEFFDFSAEGFYWVDKSLQLDGDSVAHRS
ncbi:hypothetical protein Peur_057716 [Populus x canadensis]